MKKTILSLLVAVGLIGSASAQETITNAFSFTGSLQTFTVPLDVNLIQFNIFGASGGDVPSFGALGGYGADVAGTMNVTPGDILNIFVGGLGGPGGQTAAAYYSGVPQAYQGYGVGGYNGGGGNSQVYERAFGGNSYYWVYTIGGGGGGSTDIRIGGLDLTNRVAVAGGGGGASDNGGAYGFAQFNSYGVNGVSANQGITSGYGSGITNAILGFGQSTSGGAGAGGGGYYGGIAGGDYYVWKGQVSSGQGGSSWVDTNIVSASLITNSASAGQNGFVSISYTAVPEPSTYALFGIGAIGMLMVLRRKKTA